MEISQVALARLYLLALVVGGLLGVIYDVLRISRVFLGVQYSRRATERLKRLRLPLIKGISNRRESPILGTVIFFEDLLFGILCGIAMILLFYGANNGNVRLLAVPITLVGFFLYRQTIGRAVMLFSEVIAFFAETILRYAVFFLLFPFRWTTRKIGRGISVAVTAACNRERRRRRQRYTTLVERQTNTACGMISQGKGRLKRGRRYGEKNEKAIQLEHSDASISCGHRGGLSGRVRKQRHEIQ